MKFITLIILVCTMALWISGAESNEFKNSINLGYGGINPLPHCNTKIYIIEYEHSYTSTITILGRGNGLHYKFDDGSYQEDGRLRGADLGARYYPEGSMHGFFAGASLGYWAGHWPFIRDMNTPSEWQGKGSTDAVRMNFDVGYRVLIPTTKISIMPEVNLGKFYYSNSCEYTAPASRIKTPCFQKSEVNYYLFAGLAVGVVF